MTRIAVVSGGIGGLATAFRLLERHRAAGTQATITIYEAGARWGGVIASSHENGFTLEHGPDSILRSKPAGLRLITDLGLEADLQPTEENARRSLIARGRRLLPIPEGLYLLAPGKWWPFMCSPLMSWPGKLRMALDLFLPRRDPLLTEESLAEFVRRRLGREALERIAQPLVSGIYTADPEQLSLASTMPQFIEMEQKHRSLLLAMRARARDPQIAAAAGPRYGLFTSLRGGLQRLTDRLVEVLAPHCVMKLSTPVALAVRDGGRFYIKLSDGRHEEHEQVVLAGPANAMAPIARGLDQVLGYLLATVPYAGVACINLAFRREQLPNLPQAAGFVVPAVEKRTTIACTFADKKYGGRAPNTHVLLRAFVGGALNEAALDRDDATLIEGVLGDLRDLLGLQGKPLFARVHRWPKAMAQFVLGHGDRLKVIRVREGIVPGLALVGNAYEGVGIPDLAAQAEAAADRLAGARLPPVVDNEATRADTA